ncbi:MAG: DMT family transporter [Alphaproteobacteria bacterium]
MTPRATSAARVPARAVLLMIGTVALFAVSDALAKYVSTGSSLVLLVWSRYLFQTLFMVVFLVRYRPRELVRTRRPWLQTWRSLASVGSNYAFIFALPYIPLADAVAVGLASPLMVTALSVPLLGERVGVRRWSAVVVGFAGAMIVLRPGLGIVHWSALFVLVAAALYALYQIGTRILAPIDSPVATLFYTGAVGLVATSVPVPFSWVELPTEIWVILAAQGLASGLSHFLLIKAFALAPVSTLAPFSYTEIVSAAVLGYLMFGDVPDQWTVLGSTVIVGSGLYVMYRAGAAARAGGRVRFPGRDRRV